MTPRSLGASANDRIKEHLGLLHDPAESDVSLPTHVSPRPDLSAVSDDVFIPNSMSSLSSPKEFALSPIPVINTPISPNSPPSHGGSPPAQPSRASPHLQPTLSSPSLSFQPSTAVPVASFPHPSSAQSMPQAEESRPSRPAEGESEAEEGGSGAEE